MADASSPPRATDLPALRREIDRLDRRLLGLLNQRARLAMRAGWIKRRQGLAVFDGEREERLLRRVAQANRGPLTAAAVRRIFTEILRQSRRVEVARRPSGARTRAVDAGDGVSRGAPRPAVFR
jgi:chorismate mutase/prephenate dehydratase